MRLHEEDDDTQGPHIDPELPIEDEGDEDFDPDSDEVDDPDAELDEECEEPGITDPENPLAQE